MGFLQNKTKSAGALAPVPADTTTKARGDAAERLALAHLQEAGLAMVARNYRTPGRGGGEIDLVMRTADATLVFVEVRQRARATHGGAGASVTAAKQRRIVFAARHYLMKLPTPPPCRFDVVLVDARPHRMAQGCFRCGVMIRRRTAERRGRKGLAEGAKKREKWPKRPQILRKQL